MTAPQASAQPNTIRPRYHAVVTYVPEEFIWCDWLHGQLNETDVPADLAGARTRHGFTRPAQVSIFPDPRNAVHLARQATALPPCRYLIVVCSPDSAKSPALDEQIRLFKRTEGEDRIVVLVVDGDPEHHDAATAQKNSDWLPTWLRYRLDENDNFRPGEESEPLIIDARSEKMPLAEARAQILAAVLDLPRAELHAHGDLLHAAAHATLFAEPASEAESAETGAPRGKKGPFVWIAAACVVLAGGAAFGLRPSAKPAGQPAGPAVAVVPASTPVQPVAKVSSPASVPTTAPAPAPATPAAAAETAAPQPRVMVTAPTVRPAIATPAETEAPVLAAAKKPAATPVAVLASASQPAKPAARKPDSRVPAATAKPAKRSGKVASFVPTEGPQTPIRAMDAPEQEEKTAAPPSSWQQMRDLGDTLMQKGNREAGLIALSQATDTALKTASEEKATAEERIDVARLCFRVGVLQRQFFSPQEGRRTLERAVTLLQAMTPGQEIAEERETLLADLGELIEKIR